MALSVRKKIWYGTAFLFVLLIITGGVSIYQIITLRQETKEVLRNNYESLFYCHTIQQQLDSLSYTGNRALSVIDNSIKNQEANVTELGEKNATILLRASFGRLSAGDTSVSNMQQMKRQLHTILTLNMQAIQLKSIRAERSAETNLTFIVTAFCLVIIVAFTFSVNFPSIVTSPINALLEAIEQISSKNYRHRVRIDNKDEFGNLAASFNQMAERLEYFESSNLNKLLFEKTRAEAVINSLKDASIGIDKNGTVLFANYQALQFLGIKSADIVGALAVDVSEKNDLFKFLVNDDATAPFKIVVEGRENFFIKETVDIAQEATSSKVIILKNITSFKELDAAKTNFIATISHELKTPLASSDFSLKLLQDKRTGTLSVDQSELVEHLKDDNRRMLKILSELLNMAQVEAGKIQLHKQMVSPTDLVTNAIQNVASSVQAKQLTIRTDVDPNLPLIHVDAEKTTWVLNNFLTNAIKFSPAGETVTVSVKEEERSIIFSVADHGPGIPAEYNIRVFERYFQIPDSKMNGTGLGLAISKDFIEAQGGNIWLDSEPGNGACFRFSIPIAY